MQINKPVQEWQLLFQGEWPTAVTFLDNDRLAAGNRAGQILVWDLTRPAAEPTEAQKRDKAPPSTLPVRQFSGHDNGITHLLTSPDGKTLISSSLDRTVRVWDLDAPPAGQAEVVIDLHFRDEQARNKPPGEKDKILSAPGVMVDRVTGSQALEGHKDWIQALGQSADGRRLISGDDSCLSIVWDLKTRQAVSQWPGYDRVWVTSAALSPDGKTAFTAEFAGSRSDFDRPAAQARLWNADDGTLKMDLLKIWTPNVKDEDRVDSYGYAQTWGKLMKRGLVCAEFSPDGKWLAVGQGGETDKGQVHLVDASTGKIARTISGHQYGVCDLKFSTDGRYILSCGRDTMVRICQVSDGKEVAALGKSRGGQFKDWLSALAVSPDQTRIAAADIAGFVSVWTLGK